MNDLTATISDLYWRWWVVRRRPRIAVISDSIGAGTGVEPEQAWTRVIGNAQVVLNQSQGGASAYSAVRPHRPLDAPAGVTRPDDPPGFDGKEMRQANPDAVVIMLGINDRLGARHLTEFLSLYSELIGGVCDAVPTARILTINEYDLDVDDLIRRYPDLIPVAPREPQAAYGRAIRTAATRWSVGFADMQRHPVEIGSDGAHPSPAGHRAVAEFVRVQLVKASRCGAR